jgi:RNA polymerase sigma factor (sigma-70 family)
MTKPLRMDVKFRNARLIKAREELGLTTKQAAKAIGICYAHYVGFESLKEPVVGANGELRESVLKICAYMGYSPDYLFGREIRAIRKTEFTVNLDMHDMVKLASCEEGLLEQLTRKELTGQIHKALSTLTAKERKTLELRFGLIDDEERTYESAGQILDVTGGRVGQIEAKALRKLRQSCRSKKIKDYVEGQ